MPLPSGLGSILTGISTDFETYAMQENYHICVGVIIGESVSREKFKSFSV